jgi:hypothetical protein
MLAGTIAALDPIRSLGAELWVTELAPFRTGRRFQVDGWISDWRHRSGTDATSVGFAFEVQDTRVRAFHLLVHGRVRPCRDVTSVEDAVRKLQVAVKIAQGRIVLVEPQPDTSPESA